MSCLKTGISRTAAILSVCGLLAAGGYGAVKIDEKAIVPNKAVSTENTSVIQQENDKAVKDALNDILKGSVTVVPEKVRSEDRENTEVTTASSAQKTTSEQVTSVSVQISGLVSVTSPETSAVTSLAQEKETVPPVNVITIVKNQNTVKSDTSVESVKTTKTTKKTTESVETSSTTTKKTVTTTESTTTIKPTTTTKKATTTAKPTTTTKKATTTAKPTTTTKKATTTAKPTTTTKKTTTTAKPTVTTTKPVTTTAKPKPVNNGNTPESRLNAAVLNINECLSGNEHKIVKKYLDKIINDDMTNYEKAVAVYDYIINNTYYAYGGWSKPVQAVLEEGYGTCTEYAYVLSAMMNYMGFDAKTVDGLTAMAAGGFGYHMWVEVTINGQVYVMDAQVDDNMSWGGNISHARFVKTYSEVRNQYIKYKYSK